MKRKIKHIWQEIAKRSIFIVVVLLQVVAGILSMIFGDGFFAVTNSSFHNLKSPGGDSVWVRPPPALHVLPLIWQLPEKGPLTFSHEIHVQRIIIFADDGYLPVLAESFFNQLSFGVGE